MFLTKYDEKKSRQERYGEKKNSKAKEYVVADVLKKFLQLYYYEDVIRGIAVDFGLAVM